MVELRATKLPSIKPSSTQMVLVVSKAREPIYFKQNGQLARREQLLLAKGVMESLPNCLFYTLIVNSTNAEIHMPDYMVISRSSNTLITVVDQALAGQ